jgi:hypothetical protein
MTIPLRLARLEGRHRERLRRTATLFTYTDDLGRARERVIVMETGERLDLAEFRARYPDGELSEFVYHGIDPETF